MMDATLEPGQVVAARVPWTRRKHEWIVAEVKRYAGEGRYAVADKYPEDPRKPKTYMVREDALALFPAMRYEYARGDRILALWWMDDEGAWSSMFYKAIVMEAPTEARPRQVRVQFEGESISRYVDVLKTVKPLSPREWKEKRKQRKRAMMAQLQQQEAEERARKVSLSSLSDVSVGGT